MSRMRMLSVLVSVALSAVVSLIFGALFASDIDEARPYLIAALGAAGVALVAALLPWLAPRG